MSPKQITTTQQNVPTTKKPLRKTANLGRTRDSRHICNTRGVGCVKAACRRRERVGGPELGRVSVSNTWVGGAERRSAGVREWCERGCGQRRDGGYGFAREGAVQGLRGWLGSRGWLGERRLSLQGLLVASERISGGEGERRGGKIGWVGERGEEDKMAKWEIFEVKNP